MNTANKDYRSRFNVATQNKLGELVPAIPEPYYALFHSICICGKKFWTREGYKAHYALRHILFPPASPATEEDTSLKNPEQ